MSKSYQVFVALEAFLIFIVLGWILIQVYRSKLNCSQPWFFSTTNCEEEGFSNYTNCIGQGYSKEFCSQTPQSYQTDICQCSNGLLGKRLPGFGGSCVCNSDILQETNSGLDSSLSTTPGVESFSSFMVNGYH